MSIVVTFSGNVPTLTWPSTAATASLLINFCPACKQLTELLVLVLEEDVPALRNFRPILKAACGFRCLISQPQNWDAICCLMPST